MNSNRESELRRRLEMTEIPPPPPGLADRIRQDIPDELFPKTGGVRPMRTRLFPMQVAASVMLLAGSAYMVTRMFIVGEPAAMQTGAFQKEAPVVATTGPTADNAAPAIHAFDRAPEVATPPSAAATGGASTSQARSNLDRGLVAPAPAAPAVASAEPLRQRDEREQDAARDAAAPVPQVAYAPVPPPPAPVPYAEAPAAVAQATTEEKKETALYIDDAVQEVRETSVAKSRADAPARRAAAGVVAPQLAAGPRESGRIFGISVDDSSIARIRATLDRGERPVAGSINGEAFVTYFAGPAKPRAAVALEAEGSTMPVSTAARKVLLRFSVDTATAASGHGPVGRDARIDININPRTVAHFRRIGGDDEVSGAEPYLDHDVSVTAVYELELKPLTARPQQVATVTMRYRETVTGAWKTLTKRLDVVDFQRDWENATRRHRLATLSGLLSESLQGTPTGIDLARRAEELANQEPKDARARELANVATASSRLRSSSPTGSGR
jgi:hypothetical protein